MALVKSGPATPDPSLLITKLLIPSSFNPQHFLRTLQSHQQSEVLPGKGLVATGQVSCLPQGFLRGVVMGPNSQQVIMMKFLIFLPLGEGGGKWGEG